MSINYRYETDTNYIRATKGELIERCCNQNPVTVIQYDGAPGMVSGGDKDGDDLVSRIADELISMPGVRVLITPTTSKADILRILAKIRGWIDTNWDDWEAIAPEVICKGLAWYRNEARDMLPLCAFCAGDRDEPLEIDKAVTERFPPNHCECCAKHDRDKNRPSERYMPF